MNVRAPTARRNTSIRLLLVALLAPALTGCAATTGAASPGDTLLVGVAIVVGGFVVSQLASVLRDIRDALALIARALGSMALATLLLIAAAVGVLLAILNG